MKDCADCTYLPCRNGNSCWKKTKTAGALFAEGLLMMARPWALVNAPTPSTAHVWMLGLPNEGMSHVRIESQSPRYYDTCCGEDAHGLCTSECVCLHRHADLGPGSPLDRTRISPKEATFLLLLQRPPATCMDTTLLGCPLTVNSRRVPRSQAPNLRPNSWPGLRHVAAGVMPTEASRLSTQRKPVQTGLVIQTVPRWRRTASEALLCENPEYGTS